MNKIILPSYLLFLSFTSAFAISGWLTVPTFFSILFFLCLILLFMTKTCVMKFSNNDLILSLLLFSVSVSFIFNYLILRSPKQINHVAAYIFTFGVQFYAFKTILNQYIRSYEAWLRIIRFLTAGLVLTSLFGLLEFGLKFNAFIDIDAYIPRPAAQNDYFPTFDVFFRVRSFVEESGHLALYIEILAPIVFWYVYTYASKRFALFVIILTSLCFILAFSSIGFFILALDLFIVIFRQIKKFLFQRNIKMGYSSAWGLLGIILFISILFFISFDVNQFINNMFLLKLESSSGSRRSDAIGTAFALFTDSGPVHWLIGFGPGAYDALNIDSIISFFANFIFEAGVLGFSLILLFLMNVYLNVKRISNPNLRFAFSIATLNALIHYFVVSNYWYPWIWVLIAIMLNLLNIQRQETALTNRRLTEAGLI